MARRLLAHVSVRAQVNGDIRLRTLRISTWTLLALAALVTFGLPAHANSTCKVVPSWCPPPTGGGGGGTSVPEPATLAVLAAGVCAAGLAHRRRRNKK
jgi:hypothetical protein